MGAQVAGPVATFAISRFRVPAMAAFAIGAAWVLARGAPRWREAAPRERWLAIAAAAAIAGMIAMRWGDLSGNAWA